MNLHAKALACAGHVNARRAFATASDLWPTGCHERGVPRNPSEEPCVAMNDSPSRDWDPCSEEVQRDQIAAYDALRRRCPVAYSDNQHWSLLRHADVMRVLEDHRSFSSVVSASHLSVPNGMDPPRHTLFRRLIEPYFGADAMRAFEPECRRVAREGVSALQRGDGIEVMERLAHPFALRIQCAFMGWNPAVLEPLDGWMRRSQAASASGDRAAIARLAQEFDGYIRAILARRRALGAAAPDDVTMRLLHERVEGRALTDEEIASILRNWTAGELGTIAAAVGILVEYLAARPQLQQQLRMEPARLPAAIDEILRIHAPLVANRRVTTCPVEIGGRQIGAGERVTILWASANRDEAVFGDPDEFLPDRDPVPNLLYGAGVHVCPGAPLARMELQHLMEELLCATRSITPVPGREPRRAVYPASGFVGVWARLE